MLYKRKKRTARRPLSRKKGTEQSGTENGQHPEELRRRLLGLVFVFLLLFGLCEARLAHLALDADAAAAVRRQSSWEQQLTQGRGIIYDHDLEPLTDTIRQAAAVVTAGSSGYNDLFRLALPQDRTLLYSGVGGSRPFVVRLNALPETETAAVTFTYPMRYNVLPLAQHIIGYCSGDGRGVAGMERAFDDWLQGGADVLWAECSTTALAQAAGDVRLVQKQGSGNALQLTLLRAAACPEMRADNGKHEFTYAFLPWEGSFPESPVIQEAYDLNVPLQTAEGACEPFSAFEVNRANIFIDTVKPAEDGSGDMILRLYEAKRADTACKLTLRLPVRNVFLCDMLENRAEELQVTDGCVALHFHPFEVRTLRLVRKA